MLFFQVFTLVAAALVSSVSANPEADPLLGGLINLNPNILTGGGALINLGVLANVLGPNNCSANAVVGVKANINLLNLISVCACVEVLNTNPAGVSPCPACPANAHRICNSANCGCECDSGYYSANNTCVPTTNCASPNTLTNLTNGRSTCTCNNGAGFISNALGGCINVCAQIS